MLQPVIFDLYHTLVDGGDDDRDRVVGEMALVMGADPGELVAAYHATWRDRLVRWGVEETVGLLAQRLGVFPTTEQVARAGALRRAFASRLLETVSVGTLDVLDRLRAGGHPMALVSNATSDTAEAWSQSRLASRFDVVVFSCEVGLAKPDPGIYRMASERLGVDPAECVFVGDGADDELAGATAVGMTVLRTTEHNDTAPYWNGPAIAALGVLPGLVGELDSARQVGNAVFDV